MIFSLNPTIAIWYAHEHPHNFYLHNETFDWSFDMSVVLVESKDQERYADLMPIGKIEPRFGSLGF